MSVDKFNSCRFRKGPVDCFIGVGCCGAAHVGVSECYLCLHPVAVTEDLKPEICEVCIYFEPKEENEQRTSN